MRATNKKLHWTQRPENKQRVIAWKNSVGAAQKGKKKGRRKQSISKDSPFAVKEQEKPKSLTHIEALEHLMKDVDARLLEIDKEITLLEQERLELNRSFKGLKHPDSNQTGFDS